MREVIRPDLTKFNLFHDDLLLRKTEARSATAERSIAREGALLGGYGQGTVFFSEIPIPGLAGETGASGDVGTVYPTEGLKIGGIEIAPPTYGPPRNPPPM
jgi:hypothetical protein